MYSSTKIIFVSLFTYFAFFINDIDEYMFTVNLYCDMVWMNICSLSILFVAMDWPKALECRARARSRICQFIAGRRTIIWSPSGANSRVLNWMVGALGRTSVVALTAVDRPMLRSCLGRRCWHTAWKHRRFEVDV